MTNEHRRIPASSLMITVVLSLVIGLICAAFIRLAYVQALERTDADMEDKLSRNLESAIDIVMEDDPPAGQPLQKSLDLFGQGSDSTYIREEKWGVYDAAYIRVVAGRRMKQKGLFVGSLLPDTLDGCLYLAEHREVLSVVGNTLLTGNAYLPKAGVRPAYVNQRGYAYTTLVNGNIERSAGRLPAIDSQLLRHYIDLQAEDTAMKRSDPVPDTAMQSFGDTIQLIRAHGVAELSGTSLSGHILVVSDSLILVDGNARLDNIVLTAPVIRFRSGFSGRVQAIVSDSIIAESGCQFGYPSSIALYKKKESSFQPRLILGENCLLNGAVVAFCDSADKYQVYTEIDAGTQIRGILYANGYLVFKGTVKGLTLTDYFLYKGSSIVFDNFLVDAELNRSKLDTSFAGPVVFTGRKRNRVIQWVR
jgi:hypothetical protein